MVRVTVEDGYVPTPPAVADLMVKSLFAEAPSKDDRILFPGAGTGCIAAAVRRFCSVRDYPCPEAVTVDTSAERLAVLEEHVASSTPEVPPISERSRSRLRATYPMGTRPAERPVEMDIETHVADFLLEPPAGEFDYIVANPPYTRYRSLPPAKRDRYTEKFKSTTGQYPLYVPFVEQMQRLLAPDGDLVFLAPVGYLLTNSVADFREQLRRDRLERFLLLPEEVFPNVQVEPVVTALQRDDSIGRDGSFWLETFVYESLVDELLRDVGVQDQDRRQKCITEYYNSAELTKRMLRTSQKRDGADGGYNVERIPPSQRPGDSTQADIGRWT